MQTADQQGQSIVVNTHDAANVIASIINWCRGLIHPVTKILGQVAASGWIGGSVVFAIFFIFALVQLGGKVKNTAFFAAVMEYIGSRATSVFGVYLAVLCVEWVVMPPLSLLVRATGNTLTGGHPGLFESTKFLSSSGQYQSAFWSDFGQFYSHEHHALPLGFHSTIFVLVAFGCMWLVGRSLEKFVNVPATADPAVDALDLSLGGIVKRMLKRKP